MGEPATVGALTELRQQVYVLAAGLFFAAGLIDDYFYGLGIACYGRLKRMRIMPESRTPPALLVTYKENASEEEIDSVGQETGAEVEN